MISMLYEATLFEISDARPAPWSALSWGVFVPVALVSNVALAIVAWFSQALKKRWRDHAGSVQALIQQSS
jgi:hypothetical protein